MRPYSPTVLDEFDEVEGHAKLILNRAAVGDRLPTPVDDIVACANLILESEVSLHTPDAGFIRRFAAKIPKLSTVLAKLRGMLDVSENVIYLDLSVVQGRRTFIELHEVGHKVLPWQNGILLRLDYDQTLAPEVRDAYERQANHFASCTLFQMNRFDRIARDYPLALKSGMVLADMFGSSRQAAIRRFVERNHRACALLTFEKLAQPDSTTGRLYRVKTVVESPVFYKRCGEVDWPEFPPNSHPAIQAIYRKRRMFEDGEVSVDLPNGKPMDCRLHFFDNRYNPLAFIYPVDEKAHTRTKIVLTGR